MPARFNRADAIPYTTRRVATRCDGDRENALALARRKRETARNLSFPLAGVDPKLDALNGDPRFVELLASAGLTRRIR